MKHAPIPNWTYTPEYTHYKKQILSAVDQAFSSGTLILGSHVAQFEKAFAKFCDANYCIGVGNGTDAIVIAMKVLGIQPGDEIITVPNSAIATASTALVLGAKPVFIDILPDTYLMDPSAIERAITPHTKAIMPVHLYGQCCDMDAICKIAKKHHLFVIEDCAQATGATWESGKSHKEYRIRNKEFIHSKFQIPDTKFRSRTAGSMGDIATFSFYPTKILGAYGDGGAIVTNSKKYADTARMLRMYGTKGTYYSFMPGYNSRLDEVQAAILSFKLKNVPKEITVRQSLAAYYLKHLSSIPNVQLPSVDPHASHVWHLFVIQTKHRDELQRYLESHGIGTKIHYPHPLHLMRGFKHLGYKKGDFPHTEYASRHILSLPFYPWLTHAQQDIVIDRIRAFFA